MNPGSPVDELTVLREQTRSGALTTDQACAAFERLTYSVRGGRPGDEQTLAECVNDLELARFTLPVEKQPAACLRVFSRAFPLIVRSIAN